MFLLTSNTILKSREPFMRKFSVDEISRFLNLIRGKVSVMGLRLGMLEHDAEFECYLSNYNMHTFAKPSMTAQVRDVFGGGLNTYSESVDTFEDFCPDVKIIEICFRVFRAKYRGGKN